MKITKQGLVRVFVLLCAFFAAVSFVVYFFSTLTGARELLEYAAPALASLLIIIPPMTEGFWERKLPRRLFSAGGVIYSCAVVFFCVTFSCMLIAMSSFTHATPTVDAHTVVCVYGCRVKGELPGQMLRERLDCALSLLEQDPDARVIVSGGLDEGEKHTEGRVMAWYLEQNGIDAERIIIDETAESTKGNIRAFLSLTDEMEDVRLISVSSSFHMPRISYLCYRYGLDSEFVGAPTARFSYLYPSVVREYLSYVAMLLSNNYT